jgi:hypothetical protein
MIVHVQNGKTEIVCVLRTVAFPHGVDCRPCIENECTARVYIIADQVVVTRGPAQIVVGQTLVKGGQRDASLLPRFERKGHANDGARFARMALLRFKLRCAEHDLVAIVLFADSLYDMP